jgi:rod shape-determining protein MreC
MAPPSPRRPGFSRRAQYGLFAGYVVAVIGALLALLLIITSRLDPSGNSAIQGFLADMFAPISSASRAVVRTGQATFDQSSYYFDAASKNEAMTAEVKASRLALIKGRADALENARLKRLLGLVERRPVAPVTARLISSTGASSRRYATLDAGIGDGVRIGQPVRGPDGLVGRISQAGRSVSRVLLITDSGTIIPVKRLSDGMPGLAIGSGTGSLELRALASGNDSFRRGDILITSGTGGIYQPGIPVGIIYRRDRQSTMIRPFADPTALDFAIVEPIFVPELPPPPSDLPQGK